MGTLPQGQSPAPKSFMKVEKECKMCQYEGIIEHVKRKHKAFHILKMCEKEEHQEKLNTELSLPLR